MFIAFCTFWWLWAMCAAAPFFTFSSCPPLRIGKLLKLLISKNHYAFLILLCSKFVILLHVISHTGQNIRIECIHFRIAHSTNQCRVENNFIADKRVVMEKLASANSWTKWYEVLLVCQFWQMISAHDAMIIKTPINTHPSNMFVNAKTCLKLIVTVDNNPDWYVLYKGDSFRKEIILSPLKLIPFYYETRDKIKV